jgi:hypothetical protein
MAAQALLCLRSMWLWRERPVCDTSGAHGRGAGSRGTVFAIFGLLFVNVRKTPGAWILRASALACVSARGWKSAKNNPSNWSCFVLKLYWRGFKWKVDVLGHSYACGLCLELACLHLTVSGCGHKTRSTVRKNRKEETPTTNTKWRHVHISPGCPMWGKGKDTFVSHAFSPW